MVRRPALLVSTLLALVAATGYAAHADPAAEAGRAVMSQWRESVVTVKLVISTRFGMAGSDSRESESSKEITGAVIDPSGLTVVSLFSMDVTSLAAMLRSIDDSDDGFRLQSEVKDARILRGDGSEVPAEVVLRDRDLDLAFLRPKERPEKPFPAFDLSQAATPELLDTVVCLNRLGQVANRAYSVSLERIEAIVERPRTLFLPGSGQSLAGLGSPALSLDGRFVGLAVIRAIRTRGGSPFDDSGDGPIVVFLPAADLLQVAEQAPEHAVPEPAEPSANP